MTNMHYELISIITATIVIAFTHTILGPDHYIPFIALAKSGDWSVKKTTLITFLCGLGHVLSSVILGFIGIAFGIAVTKLETFESVRGNIAAWLLIAGGLIYFVWGIKQAIRNKPHTHIHSHNGIKHAHTHTHTQEHVHPHLEKKRNITPWVLFIIFVFGPCEPLIPLVMYPAAKHHFGELILVTLVFSAITIGTMMSVVLTSIYSTKRISMTRYARYTHAIAGLTILLCGLAIQFLGL